MRKSTVLKEQVVPMLDNRPALYLPIPSYSRYPAQPPTESSETETSKTIIVFGDEEDDLTAHSHVIIIEL